MIKKITTILLSLVIALPMIFTTSAATKYSPSCTNLSATGVKNIYKITYASAGTHLIQYMLQFICGKCGTYSYVMEGQTYGNCSYTIRDAGHSGSVHKFKEVCRDCGYVKSSGSVPCPGNPCVKMFSLPIEIDVFDNNDIPANFPTITSSENNETIHEHFSETIILNDENDKEVISNNEDVKEFNNDIVPNYPTIVIDEGVIIEEKMDSIYLPEILR